MAARGPDSDVSRSLDHLGCPRYSRRAPRCPTGSVPMQATRALDTAIIVVERNRAHMGERKEAVVVGALGVMGRYIVERLLRQDDWSVIGLSRRAAGAVPRYRHISVDLRDHE